MKYLLCSVERISGKGGKKGVKANREEYDDFADVVAGYVLLCECHDHVILADLEEKRIIRQYAHESGYNVEGGTSDAICIY